MTLVATESETQVVDYINAIIDENSQLRRENKLLSDVVQENEERFAKVANILDDMGDDTAGLLNILSANDEE